MPEDVKPVKPVKEAPAAAVPSTEGVAKPAPAVAGSAKKKNNKTLKIVLIVVGVLVGLSLLGTILVVLFFSALFHKAAKEVDLNEGSVTIQSEDGSKTTVGEGAKLAEDFPSDVPIFSPSTLVASTKTEDSSYSAVGKTSSSVADVTSYYKSEMAKQGWTTQLDSTADGGTVLSFQKDNRTAGVIVTSNADEASNEKTGFVVTVTTQQ